MAKILSANDAVEVIKLLNDTDIKSISDRLEELHSKTNPLWEKFNEKDKNKVLEEIKNLWSSILNNNEDKWLKKLTSLWGKLCFNKKNIILEPLSMFWGTLTDNKHKVKLWNKLSTIQKAELLELFSRKYTMAHAVFAARAITKENTENFSEVHIEIKEPSSVPNNNQPNCGGTVVIKKGKILHITINYLDSGGVGLDYIKEFISESCWRFVVSHEIAHIILHNCEYEYLCDFPHNNRNDHDMKEVEADLLAKLISDLRDRHILENYGDENDKIKSIGKQSAIVQSYKNEKGMSEVIKHKAIELDETSETFTLSNSIFAIREIIGIHESQKPSYNQVSNKEDLIAMAKSKEKHFASVLIYPDNSIDINETCVEHAINPNKFIIISKAKGIKNIANEIALILGGLSLYYEKFIDKKRIKKKDFNKQEWDEIKEFAKALLAARKNNLETVLSKIRQGSRDRILKLKKI